MEDKLKTIAPLLSELAVLRQRVAALEAQVSLHQHTEETLHLSEERWRAAHELSLDAFTILCSVRDEQGKVIDFVWEYVNPTAAQLLGRPVEDLLVHFQDTVWGITRGLCCGQPK